ncbi:hypothetical protein CK203_095947 [Vitis vinifera]|uniref:Uncharacterized protein n=1 Tax=Vitis vinifera TaxID=29760 RepID=A0A438CRW2_VITVI|nr:hypothetical protein CK203_095947 [Vitis vinifera]
MAGREVREYTNLTDPKDKKWGKGKDKIDDEDITFQRMVAKGVCVLVSGSPFVEVPQLVGGVLGKEKHRVCKRLSRASWDVLEWAVQLGCAQCSSTSSSSHNHPFMALIVVYQEINGLMGGALHSSVMDLGIAYRVVDVSRCKRLQGNVEVTFMDEAFEYAALDSDDLLYLKEQMEAEEDAERLLRRTEKRAFAAFKISFRVPLDLQLCTLGWLCHWG